MKQKSPVADEDKLNNSYVKNVNNFTHISSTVGGQQTVRFMQELRQKVSMPKIQLLSDKSTQSRRLKHTTADCKVPDFHHYEHLFRKRIGPAANIHQVSFESSLRRPRFDSIEDSEDKSRATQTTIKTHNRTFLKAKQHTQVSFNTNKSQLASLKKKEQSYDFGVHYHSYVEIDEKNAQSFYHMDKDSTGDVRRDILDWNLNLRDYSLKIPKTNSKMKNTLSSLNGDTIFNKGKRGQSF